MDIKSDFFDVVMGRKFGSSICFLCGCRLNKMNRTEEHVIPKWLQRKFKLSNQLMTLYNGTTVPYRKLTIPCCRACNNNYLQPIEKRMSKAVELGAKGVRTLDRVDVFIWLGKIFYGLLYKDLFYKWDLKDKSKRTIVDRELLKQFQTHYMFIQAVRVPMIFQGFFPASILVVDTYEPDNPQHGWDFRDDLDSMFIGCRVGKVGIIGVLQDNGANEKLFHSLKISRRKLHPVQFTEVMVRVLYKSKLFNRAPKYITIEAMDGRPKIVVSPPLQGFSNKPIFDDWNWEHYAHILSHVIRVPLSRIFIPPDRVMTWLRNEDGTPKRMPIKTFPYP